ncbi:MAG: hypothetical protein ABI986_01120 [Chloroflexota bacterium]
MTTDSILIEKREELKRRLAAGEYKTLVDVFLEWFDRLIRKITRRKEPLSLWATSTILVLIMGIAGFAIIYLTDNLITAPNIFNQYSLLGIFFIIVLFGGQAIVSVIAINQLIASNFSLLHDVVLDSVESIQSLDSLKDWLEMTCNNCNISLLQLLEESSLVYMQHHHY